MAYGDDISGLGADHHWTFDGNSNDSIGSANGTDTAITYVSAAIAEDATNCAVFDGRGDRILLPATSTIDNSSMARKTMAGWFSVNSIELPHCVIYTEGTYNNGFQFIIFAGNSLLFEIQTGSDYVQIYSDIALAPDRAYHLCGLFEGNGYGNEVRFYIDGVEQTNADPTNRQPDFANLGIRGQTGLWGDPAHTDVGIGGADWADDIQSPGDNRPTEQHIDAYYSHWCAWGDEADARLTGSSEVREILFEKGALAENTITTDTEANMQTALDALGNQDNAALNIEIQSASGGGDFTLLLKGQTFDSLASMNVRYNSNVDTLTIINTSGSDAVASKCNAPFGGTLVLKTRTTITCNVKDVTDTSNIENARVLLLAASGGPLPYQDSVSITSTGGTATVTHTAHGLLTDDKVYISGADQNEYNGVKTITVTGTNTYTYSVSGSPTSPATGTITSTAVILDDTTSASGVATVFFDYTSDQPVTGTVRKGSASTYYKTGAISATITSTGLTTTTLLVRDE